LFKQSAEDLGAHMKKEELALFPFIRNMVEAKRRGVELPKPHFGAVENPIEMMKHEHENEGDRFEKIAQLLNQYTPPSDACNTHCFCKIVNCQYYHPKSFYQYFFHKPKSRS